MALRSEDGDVFTRGAHVLELRRPPRRGIAVDGARLDLEMAARGLEGQDLARLAGVAEDTVTRARKGQRIERNNLLKLTDALLKVPVNPAVAALVGLSAPATRRNKRAVAGSTSATAMEANGARSTDAPQPG